MTVPLCPMSIYGSPVALLKFQMAPRLTLLMSSGPKKEQPRYTCLEWSQSYTLTRNVGWDFILCSTPPAKWSDGPNRWKYLHRVLCPVRRPVTALDCILLNDRSLALTPRQGPRINSQACLWVSPRPHHYPNKVNFKAYFPVSLFP